MKKQRIRWLLRGVVESSSHLVPMALAEPARRKRPRHDADAGLHIFIGELRIRAHDSGHEGAALED